MLWMCMCVYIYICIYGKHPWRRCHLMQRLPLNAENKMPRQMSVASSSWTVTSAMPPSGPPAASARCSQVDTHRALKTSQLFTRLLPWSRAPGQKRSRHSSVQTPCDTIPTVPSGRWASHRRKRAERSCTSPAASLPPGVQSPSSSAMSSGRCAQGHIAAISDLLRRRSG